MIVEKMVYICLAYLAGSILFAEISMKCIERQSLFVISQNHNPGVSNAFKYGGVKCGSLALIGDLLKGFLPVFLYIRIFKTYDIGLAFVMFSLALGHAYSIYYGFRGGMCIAVSFGIFLGLLPQWIPLTILIVTFLFFLALKKFNTSLLSIFTYIVLIAFTGITTIMGYLDITIWIGVVLISMLVCFKMRNDI